MSNQKVTFTLTGDTPLLMHMDNIDGADELKSWKAEPDNRDKTVAGLGRARRGKAGLGLGHPWCNRTAIAGRLGLARLGVAGRGLAR